MECWTSSIPPRVAVGEPVRDREQVVCRGSRTSATSPHVIGVETGRRARAQGGPTRSSGPGSSG